MLKLVASRTELPFEKLIQELDEIFAKPQTLPTRLSAALKVVAEQMGAETSYVYLLTPEHFLKTYATFNPIIPDHKAVQFRVGEGLVGLIASTGKSVITDNISRHPNFVYLPGVADYVNLSFVGVPLISSKGLIGVLSLQNPTTKPFDPWREKALMEVGNFIAKLPELEHFTALNSAEGKIEGMHALQGISFNPGLAIGTAVVHQPTTWKETDFSKSSKAEMERLKEAIRKMIEAIDRLVASTPDNNQDMQEILASYKMFASGRGWVRKMQEFINRGFTAEAAVQKIRRHFRERCADVGDQFLKGRLSDLEDLANRLLNHLSGQDQITEDLPESTILVANNLGPAELLDYDRRFIKGLVLKEGVHTAHVAIVAKALDIPVVGRIPLLLTHIRTGDKVIVDGQEGMVYVNPNSKVLKSAREKITTLKKWQVVNKELTNQPCQTKDGTPISLTLNAGLPVDLHHLEEFDFKGVGLYRTEIPFMMRSSFPDVKTQTEIYRDVISQAKGNPITFRTLDIGGDKVVPYMWRTQDENPVMGWRAIRVSLDKPAILRQQVRALMKASQGRELRILFPMVSDLNEYREARQHVEQEWARAEEGKGGHPTSLSLGVMIEVPSIVCQLPDLVKEVDFLSVGTNDLFQFYYGCDRTNPSVSQRYDTLSTAFLKYLKSIQQVCTSANVPLTLCGEMASRPLEAMALLGIGYRYLSVTGHTAGHVKKMILSASLKNLETFMEKSLKEYSPSLRTSLQTFAKKQKIEV